MERRALRAARRRTLELRPREADVARPARAPAEGASHPRRARPRRRVRRIRQATRGRRTRSAPAGPRARRARRVALSGLASTRRARAVGDERPSWARTVCRPRDDDTARAPLRTAHRVPRHRRRKSAGRSPGIPRPGRRGCAGQPAAGPERCRSACISTRRGEQRRAELGRHSAPRGEQSAARSPCRLRRTSSR